MTLQLHVRNRDSDKLLTTESKQGKLTSIYRPIVTLNLNPIVPNLKSVIKIINDYPNKLNGL